MSLLEVDGLNAYYGDSHILFDVALRVERNEVVALLGRNGAGKSTTLKSLMGVVQPRTGSVVFDGVERRRQEEPCHRPGRHAAGPRGAAHLRQPERRGEPRARRPHRAQPLAARSRLRDVPAAQGAARQPRHRPVGRRAADAGDRPGPDPRSQDRPARRAVRGAGADPGARAAGDLPHAGRGRADDRRRRAEHLGRDGPGRSRLHHQQRPHRRVARRGADARPSRTCSTATSASERPKTPLCRSATPVARPFMLFRTASVPLAHGSERAGRSRSGRL